MIYFKKFDFILFLIIIFINIFFYFFVFSSEKKEFSEDTVMIKYKNRTFYYSLNEDKIIYLKGNNIKIEIKNKNVWVAENDCPNKICILMGKINKIGEAIYCVPNGLIIKILGRKKENIDSLSY